MTDELLALRAQHAAQAAALDYAMAQNRPLEIGYNRPTMPHTFCCGICHGSPFASSPELVTHKDWCWLGRIARTTRAAAGPAKEEVGE